MKRLGILAVLALTACGPSTVIHPKTSVASPGPLTPMVSATAGVTSARSTSGHNLLFAVLEAHTPGSPPLDDTVAIVGLDGYARAKAKFQPRQRPSVCMAEPLLQPEARVAAGGVFYVDGGGVVRLLNLTGSPRQVARFPISQSQQELAFAVSPDGSKLMATVLTLPPIAPGQPGGPGCGGFAPGPFHLKVQFAKAGGSTTTTLEKDLAQTNAGQKAILSMVGWDDVGPVATIDSGLGSQQGTLGRQWFGHAARLDAAGQPGSILGGAACQAQSELPDGTVVCDDGTFQKISVRSAEGALLWNLPDRGAGYGAIALSPDRSHLAFADASMGGPAVRGRDGSTVGLPSSFYPEGWLDAETIIGVRTDNWSDPFPGRMGIVRLTAPNQLEDLGFSGSFVGVIQGAA